MSARFRKLNMEHMERREMMAADISAVLQNGNLYINEAKGSVGKDQGVLVSQLANGNIRVQGLDAAGTGVASKVNGKAYVDFSMAFNKTGSARSLFANLGAGNDLVRFDATAGVVPSFQNVTVNVGTTKGVDTDNVMVWALQTKGSITVDTGIGNDWVFLSNVDSWGTLLSINTGAGADSVTIKNDSHLRGSVDIQTYSSLSELDADIVYFDTNTVVDGSVNVRMGGGVDQFLVTDPNVSQIYWGGLTAGSISVDMGAGNDMINTRGLSTTAGNFQVFTGAGADSVLINSRSILKLDGTYFIATINGDFVGQTYSDIAEVDADSLEFLGAQINGSLIARMGAGNDYFALSGADHVSNDVDLHMDAGNDNAYIDGYVGDHIMAWMGEGDDSLRIGRIWAYRLLMDGNVGWDSLYTSNEMYANYFDYLGWEVINGFKTGVPFDFAATDAVFAQV